MSGHMAGRGWVLLLVLWLGTASPAAWAVLCNQVFPQAATSSGVVLDLAAVMDGQTYGAFPSSGASFSTPGWHFYSSGSLATWNSINVKAGATTYLFFDGDLTFQPNSEINPVAPPLSGGNPEDLVIIVRGNLTIGTKNDINALIYASGNINAQPQSGVVGAMTAGGSITMANNATVTYDGSAATTFNLPGACSDGSTPLVDHYQLSYSSNALTCQPHAITVTACANAACTSNYTSGSSSLSLQPAGTALSFTGSTSTTLAVRTASTVTLSVSSPSPTPASSLKCRIDGGAASSSCSLTFADSGLLVSVPDVLAARPDSLTISAVRKSDNSLACVPAFASVTRNVQLWQSWLDPDAATQVGNLRVQAGGAPVGLVASPSTHSLAFNASGVATLPFSYADAGQMQLDARYVGSVATNDSGLLMTGSATFVSRPYGLHLSSDRECTAASVAGCAQTQVAGDSFSLRIRPVAWQADGEAHTAAALADNATTPNFRLAGIALGSSLAAPAGGNPGGLSLASYSHALGGQNSLSLSQSEVGVFRLTAMAPATAYFGYTIPAASSALTGRFIPARLQAAVSASLTPACGSFSYQQQWMDFSGGGALLAVTAVNRQGAVTGNYDLGEFWRLATPQRSAYSGISGRSTLDARLEESGSLAASPQGDSIAADGSRQYLWADQLRWSAALLPSGDDLPLPAASPAVRLSIAAARLTDADGVCFDAGGGCSALLWDFGGSELRLGRLRFGEAYGSELQALEVPFWLESWQDNGGVQAFLPETADSCSAPLLGSPALQAVAGAGALQPSDLAGAALAPLLAGQGGVSLPAPGVAGSVLAGLSGLEGGTLPWLLWGADGDGVREADRGLATFGIQSGSTPLLFRQEGLR